MRIHSYRPAALIRVTGDDAATFLQGQFTNELRQGIWASVYGLWLNQKGKVLADSHVLQVGENEFLLSSNTSVAGSIRARLEEYIVADDVNLLEETAQVHGLVVSGPQCGEMVGRILGDAPPPGQFIQSNGLMVFAGRRQRGENYELLGPENTVAGVRGKFLALGGREITAGEMEYARIEDGVPAIPQDIGPGDLPNDGGLEDVAISFTKGCYLGQEVMARLKNMGRVRRRLHVIRGTGAAPVSSAPLYQGDRKVGQIRSVAVRGNEFVAFAMLSLVNLEPAAGLSLAPDAAAAAGIVPHG